MLVKKIKNEIEECLDPDETTIIPHKVIFNNGDNMNQVIGECKKHYNERFKHIDGSRIEIECWHFPLDNTTRYGLTLQTRSGIEDTLEIQYNCFVCSNDRNPFTTREGLKYCPVCG